MTPTSPPSHALLIGGSGFIGRHLARSLSAAGSDVTIADIVGPPTQHPFHEVDVRAALPDDLPGETETVIYLLAAVHRTPGHEPHEYLDTNIEGARSVAAFAAARGIRRIVFTSSIAVYGPGEDPKDEASKTMPVSAYGWSKLMAERVLEEWRAGDPARQLIIARPAVVFGPGEGGNFTRLASALRRRLFAYPGRRDTVKGCCYVGDLVDSFDFALRSGQSELLYNFAYPEPYTIEAICEAFHSVGGLPRPIGSLPRSALHAAAWPFEGLARIGIDLGMNRQRVAKLVRSTHIAPRRLTEMGYRFGTDLSGGLAAWKADAGAFR